MATKTVKLSEFKNELAKDVKVRTDEQKIAVVKGIIKSIPDLVANSPVDTGLYAASWDFDVLEDSAIIGNTAPHAPIIEKGARPFTPPIGPLLEWAKRVLGSSSQPPNYDSEVWGLARGVQNKIGKSGMMPRNVLEKEIPNILRNIKSELKKIG